MGVLTVSLLFGWDTNSIGSEGDTGGWDPRTMQLHPRHHIDREILEQRPDAEKGGAEGFTAAQELLRGASGRSLFRSVQHERPHTSPNWPGNASKPMPPSPARNDEVTIRTLQKHGWSHVIVKVSALADCLWLRVELV